MGYHSDGVTQKESFSPNDSVTKAEVATILSRMLRGEKYQGSEQWRYHSHLLALQKAEIISIGVNPYEQEQRSAVFEILRKITL